MADTPNTTIVSLLLDETGSMYPVRGQTISGFNEYVRILKTNELPTTFSLAAFNTNHFNMIHDGIDIKNVPVLNPEQYRPDASTNLYDSIAKLVHITEASIAHRFDSGDDKPEVIVTIFTDGEENSSVEHTTSSIKELISGKEKEGWAFVYLGANQDSFAESEKIGIAPRMVTNYDAMEPDMGIKEVAHSTGAYMKKSKLERSIDNFFTEEQEKVMIKKIKKARGKVVKAPRTR